MLTPAELDRELLLAGMRARLIVRAGLDGHDHATIDCVVQAQLRLGPVMDLERHEVANLAAAAILGYSVTHPEATDAERRYERRLHREARARRLDRAGRELEWARRSAERFAASIKAALRASEEFAHGVHNPVENHNGVVR